MALSVVPIPENAWLIGLGVIALAGSSMLLDKFNSNSICRWLGLGQRKQITSDNASQLSGEKPSARTCAAPSNYSLVLPPQRRHVLRKLLGILNSSHVIDEGHVIQHILPMKVDYRTCPDQKCTPTGFSVKEVKALGDFPDYAELSGVPLPKPYLEFNIEQALPRPYRPFRWAYHQTMSLTKMETDWWIELENSYRERIAQRKALYAQHGNDLLAALPGSELACKELMEMAIQFICARYPHYFSLTESRFLHNKILDTVEDLHAKHPLEVLLNNVPEDFGIMLRDDETGFYFFRAGVICSALGWNVASKIGLQLHEIHEPIPDYKEKMQFSMDRFFTKLPTDKPIQRGSWGLEIGKPLYMPRGDPHELHRLSQSPDLQLDDCHLRVDWQTLRRLPLSGAVVFNFKALFTPVTEFRDEPGVPALVAKILKDGKKNLMEYKNTWHVEHVVLPKLEDWAREQEDQGLVVKNWEVATLDESPWFKGWVDKWHRQQGF